MALTTVFNRLKREIGIKRCIIIDGNVGDVYLNEKKQIVDLKTYLMDMLKNMEYDDVLYWDRVEGLDGDISRLSVIDDVRSMVRRIPLTKTMSISRKMSKRREADNSRSRRKFLISSLKISKSPIAKRLLC